MAKVCVVTDSTCDLPANLRAQLELEMVPLNIHFGDEVYKDAVEMDTNRFWQHLSTSPHHPKTSQPAPGEFLELYQRLHAEGRPVVSVHLSADMSGTLGSAQIAKEMAPDAEIELVDTRSVSMGLGLIAIEAARMAQRGASATEIAEWARRTGRSQYIFFGVDTLEFLAKGGRIGRAQALLGGLLNVKPILAVDNGVVASADKVRGKTKVLPRVIELMHERIPAGSKVRAAILHARAEEEGRAWLDAFAKEYQIIESWIQPLGAVVATHAGSGTLGIAMHAVE